MTKKKENRKSAQKQKKQVNKLWFLHFGDLYIRSNSVKFGRHMCILLQET